MKSSQQITVSLSTSTILKTIGILVGIGVIWLIQDVIILVFSAVLLAGVIYPYVQWASKYKIPKILSILALYLFLLTSLTLAFALLVPAVLTEVRSLAVTYGDSWNWLRDSLGYVKHASEQYGLAGNLQTGIEGLRNQLTQTLTSTFSILTNAFGSLAGFVIVLVLALYMVLEENTIKDLVKQWLPDEYQGFAAEVTSKIVQRLGAWLRGQLLLGLIIGILAFIALTIVGVPYALLLAILAALLEFIPYLGPIASAVPAVLLALAISPTHALITGILMIVIQQAENHFIVPKVMQRSVGLNPLVSIIALMIGGTLFGIVGALFSIPLATALSVFIQEYLRFRREAAATTASPSV